MHILERCISLIAPHTCLGCGLEADRLLCDGCTHSLPLVPSRCYKCKAVTEDYAVCKSCRPQTPLRRVAVYTHYQGTAKELVHRMKYERAKQGATEIADALTDLLEVFPGHIIITHIPTASSRTRIRGYDHARLIASRLDNGGRTQSLLARVGQAHQVGAQRAVRLRQLQNAFRPIRPDRFRGQHVVLIDDVLTTGATLETAAQALKRAGAKQVDALVFAQA